MSADEKTQRMIWYEARKLLVEWQASGMSFSPIGFHVLRSDLLRFAERMVRRSIKIRLEPKP